MQAKFLQFSDLHLDSKFLGLIDLEKISLRKKELEETFKKIIQFTNAVKEEEELDFIVIAGDLFEQENFSPQSIKSLIIYGLESLKPLPVFISAGNHDPLEDTSPYLLYNWPENVHIFSSQFEKVEIKPGVNIYGVSISPENMKENMLKRLEIQNPEALNIVIMHAGESGTGESEIFGNYLPFSAQDILSSSADYFALGHYHNCRKVPREGEIVKGYYSGSPEALSFKETGERFVLKVKVEKFKPPLVEKISFQHRIYREIELDLSGIESSEEIKNLLREQSNSLQVVNVILKGDLDPDIRIDLDELQDFIRQENLFFAANLKNRTRPNYTPELIDSSPLAKNYLRILGEQRDKFPEQVIESARKLGLDAIFLREVRNWNEI